LLLGIRASLQEADFHWLPKTENGKSITGIARPNLSALSAHMRLDVITRVCHGCCLIVSLETLYFSSRPNTLHSQHQILRLVSIGFVFDMGHTAPSRDSADGTPGSTLALSDPSASSCLEMEKLIDLFEDRGFGDVRKAMIKALVDQDNQHAKRPF